MKTIKKEDVSLDVFISWLYVEDGHKEILKDVNKIIETLYFLDEEQIQSVLYSIKNLSIENREKYNLSLKSIMGLYPLSQRLVFRIIEDEIVGRKAVDIVKAYDILDWSLQKKRELLEQSIINIKGDDLKEIKDTQKSIENYENRKLKNMEKISKLAKEGSKEKELEETVKKLEEEIAYLEHSYSKEALLKQKEDLEVTRAHLQQNKSRYEDNDKKLKALEKELKKIDGSNNAKLQEILSALNALTKDFPEGEE